MKKLLSLSFSLSFCLYLYLYLCVICLIAESPAVFTVALDVDVEQERHGHLEQTDEQGVAENDEDGDGETVEITLKGIPYKPPVFEVTENVFFYESFQPDPDTDGDTGSPETYGWVLSKADEYVAQEPVIADTNAAFEEDHALFLRKKHARYGLSKKLKQPFSLDAEQVTIQFEARFHNKLSCSGAYLKFVSETELSAMKQEDGVGEEKQTEKQEQEAFSEQTPYVLMFGPDKCGNTQKLHIILRHENPVSKEVEEKHMVHSTTFVNDKNTHVYTLQLRKSDQSVRVLVDREEKALNKATKKADFKPSFISQQMIDDPEDKKPEDWEDEKQIPDPDAIKPEEWVDEEFIADESSVKPGDWDEEEDGEWEPLMLRNPEYQGEWKSPLIDNPKYVGEWEPRKIENPAYFVQELPLSNLAKISHVFIEVLANDEDISFDNILITTDYDTGKDLAENYALKKNTLEKEREAEIKLKEKKEQREKNLKDSFGVMSVLEYVYGEVTEVYERYTLPFIVSICGLTFVVFYFAFLRAPTSSDQSRQTAEEVGKKKKDEEEEEANEEEKKSAGKEGTTSSSVRRRPRRAD